VECVEQRTNPTSVDWITAFRGELHYSSEDLGYDRAKAAVEEALDECSGSEDWAALLDIVEGSRPD
jgi:hypothetical protein